MKVLLKKMYPKSEKDFSDRLFFCLVILDTTGENIAESLVNEGLATVRREGIRGNK